MVQAHKGKVLPVVLPVILDLPGFCCTLLRYPLWRLISYAFLLPRAGLYSLCPRMAVFACIVRKLKSEYKKTLPEERLRDWLWLHLDLGLRAAFEFRCKVVMLDCYLLDFLYIESAFNVQPV